MPNRTHKAVAAWCGGVAVLAWAVGASLDGAAVTTVTAASSSVNSESSSPSGPGGALPVQPVGGGACISGLNCGCIPYVTCPWNRRVHRPAAPGVKTDNHAAPAPQRP